MKKEYEPQARYDAKNTRAIMLKLNLKTDADILAWMDVQPSRQGAIKELIRAEIEKTNRGE